MGLTKRGQAGFLGVVRLGAPVESERFLKVENGPGDSSILVTQELDSW